jgi:response regulator of citrate/malate metabolism
VSSKLVAIQKSKVSRLEGELMKSKEDRSVLRRQVQAKQKKLDGLLSGSSVAV